MGIARIADWALGKLDYKIMPSAEYYALCPGGRDVDIAKDQQFLEIFGRCRDYTMTGIERAYALYKAVEYIVDNDIPGDIAECGVWRGGSCMLAALTLTRLGSEDRTLYLYDTFAGMTTPTERDINWEGQPAMEQWRRSDRGAVNEWCYGALADVQKNMGSTGYPPDRIRYVTGPVEQTIPGTMPRQLALLRLDTDWFESTYHTMQHLYPVLVGNGVLIIDDYGHWEGAREAIDRYVAEANAPLLLNRIDYTGRIAIKVA